jgi:hypothetical protein
MIIWHSRHELLHTVPAFEGWDTQSSVFIFHRIAIVPPHTLLLGPTVDIVVLFTRRKQVIGIVL